MFLALIIVHSLLIDLSKVLTAYIDTTLPREIRQRDLKETYNFSCKCILCKRHLDVDPRESLWCPKLCGARCPLPTEGNPEIDRINGISFILTFHAENKFTLCSQCNAPVAASTIDSVLDAVRIGQEALDKITSIQCKGQSLVPLFPQLWPGSDF